MSNVMAIRDGATEQLAFSHFEQSKRIFRSVRRICPFSVFVTNRKKMSGMNQFVQ